MELDVRESLVQEGQVERLDAVPVLDTVLEGDVGISEIEVVKMKDECGGEYVAE